MSEEKIYKYPSDCVYHLCCWLVSGQLDNGQLAALRRSDPSAKPPAFYWLSAHIEQQLLKRDIPPYEEGQWALLIHCLSLLTPPGEPDRKDPGNSARNPHRQTIPLGLALAEAGFSELRLSSLLQAQGDQMAKKLVRCCRFLASKNEKFDGRDLARLISFQQPSDPGYNRIRQTIARDYYRRLSQKSIQDIAKDAS